MSSFRKLYIFKKLHQPDWKSTWAQVSRAWWQKNVHSIYYTYHRITILLIRREENRILHTSLVNYCEFHYPQTLNKKLCTSWRQIREDKQTTNCLTILQPPNANKRSFGKWNDKWQETNTLQYLQNKKRQLLPYMTECILTLVGCRNQECG